MVNYGARLMSKVFTDVRVFMNAAGQDIPPFNADESDQSRLYKKLIDEEYSEFIEAWEANDDVEKADACFDMMWVIVGYMHSRGWDTSAIWDEGSWSNLSKIDPITKRVIKREDGKVLKPEGWKPPDFSKFVK
jgi:predicted HAD superfamily Cof-like phosphohydrolase